MSSFNEFEGIPASANKYLLTDVLRDQYGFKGFVVSDATAVQEMVAHGIGNLQEVSERALQAGLDMDMGSDAFVTTLKKSLDEKRISKKDIDIACRRILEAKYKLGLFEDPFKYLDEERAKNETFTDEARTLAREAANESQVLLKNNGILPLKKSARVAVIGPMSDDKESMSGSWSMSKMGSRNVSIYQGIKELSHNTVTKAEGSWMLNDEDLEFNAKYGLMAMFVPGFKGAPLHTTPQEKLIAEAVAYAKNADVVVACVGELNSMNGEGASRSDISLPDAQEELLKALKATGKPVVMVLTTGRPLVLNWEEENLDAILLTWSEGSEAGHSIADVLYGEVNPSGKLTTSFPRSVGQEPLYYNHKNTGRPHPDYDPYKKFTSCYMDVLNSPLYPFGFGLSYTSFEYGDIKLSSDSMKENGKIKASIEVKNTGKYDGMETVQLYIHDCLSTSTRPVKELKGFQKIFLKAGEKQKVVFEITSEQLKYYNHELEYVCEPGEFEVFIGPDSQDLSRAIITLK